MLGPIRFLLNDEEVETECSPGLLVLDFLRKRLGLIGTKEGCKEGDCGACAVLVGELKGNFSLLSTIDLLSPSHGGDRG